MMTKTAVSSPNGVASIRADLRSLYRRRTAVDDLIRSLRFYSKVSGQDRLLKQKAGR